jgi:hypothetical protein
MPHSVAYLVILGALASVVFVTAKALYSRRPHRRSLRIGIRSLGEILSASRREAFSSRQLRPVAMFAVAAIGFGFAVPLGRSAPRCHMGHKPCSRVATTASTGQTTTTSSTTAPTTTPTTGATTTETTPTTAITTSAPTTTAATTTVSTSSGTVAWRGDYETGSFSQWWLDQFGGGDGCGGVCGSGNVGNTTATIITTNVAQGRYAAEFRVQPCSSCPNDRAEVLASQAQTGGYVGQDWYYGWWTYFPSGQTFWSGGGDWNAITQFQGGGSVGGVEGIGINAADYPAPHLQENSRASGRHDLGLLQFDHWYHFVVHAKYEQDSTGVFQVYVDGTLAADLHEPTMVSGSNPEIEISQGYYSNASSDNTVIQDGLCRATSYDAAAAC